MKGLIRPRISNEDDLEKLQEEFLSKGTAPSASVVRGAPPPSCVGSRSPQKKQSVFAQRRQMAKQQPLPADNDDAFASMPDLEDVQENITEQSRYVEDPHPEPHVPVSKNMLDLSSLLGNVLGEVTEKQVDRVEPPTLKSGHERSHEHAQGFPKPARRSLFKMRLEKKQNGPAPSSVTIEPQGQAEDSMEDYERENMERIDAMSEQEIEEARREIMNTLSSESIALLLDRKKKKNTVTKSASGPEGQGVAEEKAVAIKEEEEEDLMVMKQKYFADVPTEYEKLAWMDSRFEVPEPRQEVDQQMTMSKSDKLYREVRFDLQGLPVDPKKDVPTYQGLHHHGDDPEKAGYTLAELFHLVRSQVPSQRAMVLTTLARIIRYAKKEKAADILDLFFRPDLMSVVYLRSALDDSHLVGCVAAVQALAALVLDDEGEDLENKTLDVTAFNEYLGYVSRPIIRKDKSEVTGINERLTKTVDRIKGKDGGADDEAPEDDAHLAQRDLARGLVRMKLLPRLRYLMSPNSELRSRDPRSIEKLVLVLIKVAQAGADTCKAIAEHDLIDIVIDWGVLKRDWPMTDENRADAYPSLAALQLLTVLAQGSRDVAKLINSDATCLMQYLVISPDVACEKMQNRAYALQVEALKLVHILLCYGLVMPTLSDLHEPMMLWLRAALEPKDIDNRSDARAATAIALLESSFHAAADPHKTVPTHAIDWHQPTAFLPVILAMLRTREPSPVLDAAVGYFGTFATYMDRFPSVDDTITFADVWKAIAPNLHKFGRVNNTNSVLRYVQLLSAFSNVKNPSLGSASQEARDMLAAAVERVKCVYNDDVLGRIAMLTWMAATDSREKRSQLWGDTSYYAAEITVTATSTQAGAFESHLAHKLVQLCVLDSADDKTYSVLAPFYLGQDPPALSALYEHNGVALDTLVYPMLEPSMTAPANATAFLFSPIDEEYHLDKSRLAQKSQGPVEVVRATLELAARMFKHGGIDHDVAVISLMKIFLIGDREGQTIESEREVFWDDDVSRWIKHWLDMLCKSHMARGEGKVDLSYPPTIEAAWRRSSWAHPTRQPFYQFYQAFVAQYAAVSFGESNFGRLLAYIMMEANDEVDFKHLLWSDYRDILHTIRVARSELPPMEATTEIRSALLQLYVSAVMENKLSRQPNENALYAYAIEQLKHSSANAPQALKHDIQAVLKLHEGQ
ncbi:hypothetical protein BX666DRAFT_1873549 [Dichotomocladium elegans]|nr:hypothetical protein BX666DRAFT_1873549 [Dichotomocladium elegans]